MEFYFAFALGLLLGTLLVLFLHKDDKSKTQGGKEFNPPRPKRKPEYNFELERVVVRRDQCIYYAWIKPLPLGSRDYILQIFRTEREAMAWFEEQAKFLGAEKLEIKRTIR